MLTHTSAHIRGIRVSAVCLKSASKDTQSRNLREFGVFLVSNIVCELV
jgi:hypothetical protein